MSSYSSGNYSINDSSEYSSHYSIPSEYSHLRNNRFQSISTFNLTSPEYTTGMKPRSSSPLKFDSRVHILPGTNKNQYQIPIPALLIKPPMISDRNRIRESNEVMPQSSSSNNTTLSYNPKDNQPSPSPVSDHSSTFSSLNSPIHSIYSSSPTSDYHANEKSSPNHQRISLRYSPQASPVKMSPLEEGFRYAEGSQQLSTYKFAQNNSGIPNKSEIYSGFNRVPAKRDIQEPYIRKCKKTPKKLPTEPKLIYEDDAVDSIVRSPLTTKFPKNEEPMLTHSNEITPQPRSTKSSQNTSPLLSESGFDINSNYRINQTAKKLIEESTFDFAQLNQLNQSVALHDGSTKQTYLNKAEKEEEKTLEKTKKKYKFWFFGLKKKLNDKPKEPVNVFTKREVPIEIIDNSNSDNESFNDLINGNNNCEANSNVSEDDVPIISREFKETKDRKSNIKNHYIQSPNVLSFMSDRTKYNSYISNHSYSTSISSQSACTIKDCSENFNIKNSNGIIIFSSLGVEAPVSKNKASHFKICDNLTEDLSASANSLDNKLIHATDKKEESISDESHSLTFLSKRNTILRKSGLPIKETNVSAKVGSSTNHYSKISEPTNKEEEEEEEEDTDESDEYDKTVEQYSPINENISVFETSQMSPKNNQNTNKGPEDFTASIKAYTDSIKNYTASLAFDMNSSDGSLQKNNESESEDQSKDDLLDDINDDYLVVHNPDETITSVDKNSYTSLKHENSKMCGNDSSFYGDERDITERLVVTPIFGQDKNSFYQGDSPYTEFIKDIIPTYGIHQEKVFNESSFLGTDNISHKSSENSFRASTVSPLKVYSKKDIRSFTDNSYISLNDFQLGAKSERVRLCVVNQDHNKSFESESNCLVNDLEFFGVEEMKDIIKKDRDFSFAASVCSDVEFEKNIGSVVEIRKNIYESSQKQLQIRQPSFADSVIYYKESDLVHRPYETKDNYSDWETVEGSSRVNSIASNESTLLSAVNSLYKDYISKKGYINIQEMCINNSMTLPAAIRQIKTET